MSGLPSVPSLAACLLYVFVALSAWQAARTARESNADFRSARLWKVLAALFLLLLLSRLFMLEELVRDMLRDWLRAGRGYETRHQWQVPLAACALMAFALSASWVFRAARGRTTYRGAPWVLAGKLAILAMIALVALRLISFHAIDALLYGGPHLNWVIDIGASMLAGTAAWRYRLEVRG